MFTVNVNGKRARSQETAEIRWFPVFRSNDLCQLGDDADAIAAAQTEAWENAHREGRGHRPRLREKHPWAPLEMIDDGIAYAARVAGLEAVVETAARMLAEITVKPDTEAKGAA